MPFPLAFLAGKTLSARPTEPDPSSFPPYSIAIMQSKGLKTKVLKRFFKPLITLPKERLPYPSL
jgi:hypothetical protein